MEWGVFVEESTGLIGDCMWGMTHGKNKGGLLGLRFEKWGVYHDAMSQDGGDLSGEQVSEENRVPSWSYKFEMLVAYPSGEIRWHQCPRHPLSLSQWCQLSPPEAPPHFQDGGLIKAVVS